MQTLTTTPLPKVIPIASKITLTLEKVITSSFSIPVNFTLQATKTIGDVPKLQIQEQQEQSEGENAFHHHFTRAIKLAMWRSDIGNKSTLDKSMNGFFARRKLCGLFMKESETINLAPERLELLSKYRRFVMEALLDSTGLTEEQIADLLDIKIKKINKYFIIWNKKESYRTSPKYQQLLQEENPTKEAKPRKERNTQQARKYKQTKQKKVLKLVQQIRSQSNNW